MRVSGEVSLFIMLTDNLFTRKLLVLRSYYATYFSLPRFF
jgi:hypothetical protein